MKTLKIKNGWGLMVLLISLLLLPYPGVLKGADIPSADDVVVAKANLPTIEELTGGKVKKGDVIDKNNVDFVKEWLSPGTLELVMQGMKMIMGTNSIPFDGVNPSFKELTEKNRGKAVMDTTGAVYYEKIGTLWPGGLPYPDPKTGDEVMANAKYGIGLDDFQTIGTLTFVNKNGKAYKNIGMGSIQIWCNTRSYFEPFGTAPGYENQMYRRLSLLTSPIEIKGQGSFNVRYYDDSKIYDSGFQYFPSFKRTLRISTTVFQDNIAGSDLTHGDSQGFNEPYADWNFKLLGTEYFLHPEHVAPFEYLSKKGVLNPKLQWDEGRRFARFGWAVFPMHIVEATPKGRHVYKKKIMYVQPYPFYQPAGMLELVNNYDNQGKLWKIYLLHNGYVNKEWKCNYPWGATMHDLQAQHCTQFWFYLLMNQGFKPNKCSFKELLRAGR